MSRHVFLLLGAVCIACLLAFSGCAGTDEGTTPPQMTPTPRVTTTTPTGGGALTPQAIQTMPPGQEVSVDITRDQIQPTITVTFRGGKGQYLVRDIEVKVTRSDGRAYTDNLVPTVGDEAIFQGTKGKDRVEVTVFLKDGKQYKIIDTLVDYYGHA